MQNGATHEGEMFSDRILRAQDLGQHAELGVWGHVLLHSSDKIGFVCVLAGLMWELPRQGLFVASVRGQVGSTAPCRQEMVACGPVLHYLDSHLSWPRGAQPPCSATSGFREAHGVSHLSGTR